MRIIVRYKFLAILVMLFFVLQIKAQQNNTLFLMHELPQSNIVNPAVQIPCKLYIAIPLIGSTHINAYSSGFSFNDIFEKGSDDIFYIKPENIVDKANKYEIIATETHLTLLSFGYKFKQNYFTFSINEKINTYQLFSKNLASFIIHGNSQFEGKNADFGNLRVNGNHYREYAFGWSRNINEKLQLGFKLKLLYGKANIYTNPSIINLYTDKNTFNLNLVSSIDTYTSLPAEFNTNSKNQVNDVHLPKDFNKKEYLMNTDNKGAGFDFGMIYEINEDYTLSASLLDIGKINWQGNLNHLQSRGSLDVTGSTFQNGLNDANEFSDTLLTVFRPKLYTKNYSSPLVPNTYIGLTRNINDWINVGSVYHAEFFKKRIHSSFTFSANTELINKHLYSSVSYTLQNNQFNNIGIGIGAKVGSVHFHAISDNIPAFFSLLDARNVNLRFGISILTGCGKEKSRQGTKNLPGALPCYKSPYSKSTKRPKR